MPIIGLETRLSSENMKFKKIPQKNIELFKRITIYYFIPLLLLGVLSYFLGILKTTLLIYPFVFLTFYLTTGKFLGHNIFTIVYSKYSRRLIKLLFHISLVFVVVIPLFNISLNPEYVQSAQNINKTIEHIINYTEIYANKTGYNLSATELNQLQSQLSYSYNPLKYLESIQNTSLAFIFFVVAILLFASYIWLVEVDFSEKHKELNALIAISVVMIFCFSIFLFLFSLNLFISGLFSFYNFFLLFLMQSLA